MNKKISYRQAKKKWKKVYKKVYGRVYIRDLRKNNPEKYRDEFYDYIDYLKERGYEIYSKRNDK